MAYLLLYIVREFAESAIKPVRYEYGVIAKTVAPARLWADSPFAGPFRNMQDLAVFICQCQRANETGTPCVVGARSRHSRRRRDDRRSGYARRSRSRRHDPRPFAVVGAVRRTDLRLAAPAGDRN